MDPKTPRARAFGEFLAEVADRVHQLDPHHPIVYRDSEDVYIEPIRQALRANGLEQPWMVYGINVYTFRLADLIENWPTAGMRVPLLISEYGATGFSPADRPGALLAMSRLIDRHPEYVLGGVVYAWTTQGIDVIDRVYGLVDENGVPVDGTLDAIRRKHVGEGENRPH